MLLQLLVTILNRSREPEKKPWEKDNSWLINTNLIPSIVVTPIAYKNIASEEHIMTSVSDIALSVIPVYYKNMKSEESVLAGISDIIITVTKI